ncbi:hypothetical protein [Microbulbifer sp. GL-2]|uniref:hypothetical protein n=1 Tax=Microbulbifer sp. GL-2 TaxID=2591606 RepID=UPI00116592BB|nr:hypothetical protein [Microbulbifer sp. GL-2]BBM01864.1 hypothetical protein GL2_19380 [Microbulbifer sp. GL-2]
MQKMDLDSSGEYPDSDTSAGVIASVRLTESATGETGYTFVETDVDCWSGSVVYHF